MVVTIQKIVNLKSAGFPYLRKLIGNSLLMGYFIFALTNLESMPQLHFCYVDVTKKCLTSNKSNTSITDDIKKWFGPNLCAFTPKF